MKLVIFGPPGAGKGTIAGKLSAEKKIPHISTGDLFRTAISNETELGKKVKTRLESGALAPDDVTVDLVRERLAENDVAPGFILDGFPRTIPQAKALADISPLDRIINLVVADQVLIARLAGRRVCSACGFSYHVDYLPPREQGICDQCGGKLVQRDDDTEASIRRRLRVYVSRTEPLIGYYRDLDIISDVDGAPLPDDVYQSVLAVLER